MVRLRKCECFHQSLYICLMTPITMYGRRVSVIESLSVSYKFLQEIVQSLVIWSDRTINK